MSSAARLSMVATQPRGSLLKGEAIASRATATIGLLFGSGMLLTAGAAFATFSASSATGRSFTSSEVIRTAMHTSTVSTLVLALLAGLVSTTGEFRHGHIDQLVLGSPRRSSIVFAKGALSVGIGLLFGLVGSTVSGLSAWSYFRLNDATLDVTRSIVWRPLVGLVVAAPLCALLGVGIGFAARQQAATIGTVLGWVLLVEPLAAQGIAAVARWFPLAAALALTSSPDPHLMAPVPGGLVLISYVAVAVTIGMVRFHKSDI